MLRDMDLFRRFVQVTGDTPPALQRGGLGSFGTEYLDLSSDYSSSGLPPRPWDDEPEDRRRSARASRSHVRPPGNVAPSSRIARIHQTDPSRLFPTTHQLLLPAILSPWEGRVVPYKHDEPVVVSDCTNQLRLNFRNPDDFHPPFAKVLGEWAGVGRDSETGASASKFTGNNQAGGLTMKPRALILRQSGDQFANLYAVELALRGYNVEVYDNQAEMLDLLSRDRETQVIVLDMPRSAMHQGVLARIRRVARLSPPQVVWCGERNQTVEDEATEFKHQLMGLEDAVKIVLTGSYASFKSRLDFIEGWLRINKLPVLTIRHSIEFLPRVGDSAMLRSRSRPRTCDPREVVSDLLVEGISVLEASRTLPNPVLPSDLYLFDWLDHVGDAVSLDEHVAGPRNEGPYAFAHRLARIDGARRALDRLQRSMEVFGLHGDSVIPERFGQYCIDRTIVRVEVEHFRK